MDILYCRVSTLDQKTDRQKVTASHYTAIIEDKCSGSIPFFDRSGGKEVLQLVNKQAIRCLTAVSIDRLGRDVRDILNTLHYLTERKIPVKFLSPGICTIDEAGQENPISKMIVSILGIVGEMERNQIRERQKEGIKIAKIKGLYKGRKKGTKEDPLVFLAKEKNAVALKLLKKGFSCGKVSEKAGVHINTITKIKKAAGLS